MMASGDAAAGSGRDLTVANLSCPIDVMRFRLIYNGPLPASGNKRKAPEARDIRDGLHPQLEYLWSTHTALKRLRSTARVPQTPGRYIGSVETPLGPEVDPDSPLREGYVDLCEPVQRGEKTYVPLVRKSLDLSCSLDILFLRQEDPGEIILQGGDLDNRIKTLFDAMTVPHIDLQERYPQKQDTTYCLLESDTLISGFNVETDRLLLPKTQHHHEVNLVIEVNIKILKLGVWNLCLLGN